ncbi:MAG: Flp pilus assembly complex ATPase component TadA [Myxococcaceae bacterium]|nr:Flp pilus assembly complex ATPase component TadA [Myxococcaceae bacterium]
MSMYTESLRAFLKPVLQYLDDESVSEIMINGPEDIWIERKGRVFKTEARFSEEGLLGAARNMAQFVGRVMNDERPRLDARLPDGSRIHVVLPPIARKGTTIAIRKFFKDKLGPDSLVKFGSITPQMVRLVEAAVRVKLNMVVSGGTGSGKTTLLNVLSSLIPDDERILTIEDSAELQLNQSHLVPFESRPPDKFGKGEVSMGHLLQSALRLRPDRIVVGEVRGGEAFDLMQAMNTGHGGSMATVHANTPTDTLRRLEALCLMSTVDLPMVAVRAQVASAINFIVCCERFQDGSRKTHAIAEVLPLNDKGEYRTQDLFLFTPVTKDDEGRILGYHAPTGILPTFLTKARAYGFSDLNESFFDPVTYGVPPPPLVHGLGEQVTVHWAPSLKHREDHQPDPDEYEENWRAFEAKLRADAGAKRAEGKPAGAVQVPASAPVAAKKPAAGPTPQLAAPPRGSGMISKPAAPAQPRSQDHTPPPTRNPMGGAKPRAPATAADTGPGESNDEEKQSASTAPRPAFSPPGHTADEEPSVAISESLLGEMEEDGKVNVPPRRTQSSPGQPAVRPGNAQPRQTLPPRGVPPKRG